MSGSMLMQNCRQLYYVDIIYGQHDAHINYFNVAIYMNKLESNLLKTFLWNNRYVARWSKKACEYSAVKVRVPKTYDYIPSLMAKALANRQDDMLPLHRQHVMRDDDPRRIQPRLASKPPPPIADILERCNVSRLRIS